MAEIALGATFGFETTVGGGSYTTLGSVYDFTIPDMSMDTTDITEMSHTDSFRRHLATLADGGEAEVSIYYDPESATNATLKTIFTTKTARLYKFTFAGGATKIFSGIMTGLAFATPLDDKMTCTMKFKQSGTSTEATS